MSKAKQKLNASDVSKTSSQSKKIADVNRRVDRKIADLNEEIGKLEIKRVKMIGYIMTKTK